MPRLSTIEAIVDAVPIVLQWPFERELPASALMNCSIVILPAFTIWSKTQVLVPEPMSVPSYLPFSIGPPESAIVGMSQLAAPISRAGVVLSQPTSSTTPSIGSARIASSTSMLARLRNSIEVGRSWDSELENTGNSAGKPPISQMPRFTCSAIRRKCELQGLSSDQVLQMPMIGRPSKTWSGRPWFFIQLRWANPSLSALPYHSLLLSSLFFAAMGASLLMTIGRYVRGLRDKTGRVEI